MSFCVSFCFLFWSLGVLFVLFGFFRGGSWGLFGLFCFYIKFTGVTLVLRVGFVLFYVLFLL